MGAVLKTCQSQQPISQISQTSQINKSSIEIKIPGNPEPPPITEPQPPLNPIRGESRSGSTSLENSVEKKCIKCQKKKQEQDFIKTECKGNQCFYHKRCFEEQLRELIQKDKFVIKCKCGTKMNTNFLRSCSIPERMNLLTRLFQKQLDEIRYSTKTIRNDQEAQEFIDNNKPASEINDYFLIQKETLVYEETPQ